MIRVWVRLSEQELAAIKRLARGRSVSTAAVIRDAVGEYLDRESGFTLDERWERSLAAMGGFHSGGAVASEDHDDEFVAAASE